MLRIEFVMVGDIHKLLSLPAQSELVAFGQPLRLLLAKDMQEPRFGKLTGKLWLEGDERIHGVGIPFKGC